MLAIGLGLFGVAYVLGWSALTGGSVIDELRAVLTGEPSDARARYREARDRRQAESAALTGGQLVGAGLGRAGGDFAPVDDAGEAGAADGEPGGLGRAGGDFDTSAPAAGVEPQLVSIGQGGHRLQPAAAAALARAEARVGRKIKVTDSYRSYAQQADCYRRKPGVCAAPGKSWHERGLAIDIIEMNADDIAQALAGTGWYQATWSTAAGVKEIWHWSYGGRG